MTIHPYLPSERLRFLARAIHPLGERVPFELFVELQNGAPLIPRLEAYARLSRFADFIAAEGGDRLTPPRIVAARRARIPQPESSAAEA